MALTDFQRALADMTLDPRLAATVRQRGTEALKAYELTEREQRRLQTVACQPGMSLTCSLARANRFGPIHDAFPMTCVLLEPQLKGLLDELWHRHRPDNYQLSSEERAFVEFLEGRMASGELDVEYLEDVFRYETTCWKLAMDLRYRDLASVEGKTWVVHFCHSPSALLDALGRLEAPPTGLPLGDYEVRIHLVNGELKLEWNE